MDFMLNNGANVPSIGLGTYQLKDPDVDSVVRTAIKGGYRLIDTAAVYRNEAQIGCVLRDVIPSFVKREDIFITTKLGPAFQGSEKAKAAAINSLELLGLDYVDLYLIHWPGTSKIKPDDERNVALRKQSWLELEKLYFEGKFRAIGISNYTIDHIEELMSFCNVKPAVLQVEVHPYLTQEKLRKYCAEKGIHVQAYSSLGSRSGCSELMSDPTVVKISKSLGRTEAQILLRWAVQQGISVIPKTSKISRLSENLEIFDFTLSDDHIKALNQLDQSKHYCWNPEYIK